jgi:hypothetical protein
MKALTMDDQSIVQLTPNQQRFAAEYIVGLAVALVQCPANYPPMCDERARNAYVAVVAPRMLRAIIKGNFNHDGRGFRNACKALSIEQTRSGVLAYWNAKETT